MHSLEPISDSRTVVRIPLRLTFVAYAAIMICGGACSGGDESTMLGGAGGQIGTGA